MKPLMFFLVVLVAGWSGGSKGEGWGRTALFDPIFFHFHGVFGKIIGRYTALRSWLPIWEILEAPMVNFGSGRSKVSLEFEAKIYYLARFWLETV